MPELAENCCGTGGSRSFSVISGGPGTGKTTTVTRLLALLTELGLKRQSPPDIKLVAPRARQQPA